jgi:hypothetical protein
MTKSYDQATDAKHLCVGLSRAELLEVRAFIDMRLGMKGEAPAAGGNRSLADMVLEVVCDVARSEGIEHAFVGIMRKHAAYPAFVKKVDERVAPFLDMVQMRNRVRKRAFLQVAVRLLFDNLKQMEVPRSVLMAMNHIHRLQSVIDNSFPGYAKDGLLHMVVRMERTQAGQANQKVQRGT